MNRTAISLVGSTVLVAIIVLLGVVSYELVASVFRGSPLATIAATVPLSESELVPLILLLVGVLLLGVLFWVQAQLPNGSQYNGEE